MLTQHLIKNGLLVTGGMQVFTHPRQTKHTKPSSEWRRMAELCRSSRARANVLEQPGVNVVAVAQQRSSNRRRRLRVLALLLQGSSERCAYMSIFSTNAVVG